MKRERRSILDLFRPIKSDQLKTYTEFQELGTYKSYFGIFGDNIFDSPDVRTAIRTLSEHTSNANPRSTDKRIERLLQLNPNQYMNGQSSEISSKSKTRLSFSLSATTPGKQSDFTLYRIRHIRRSSTRTAYMCSFPLTEMLSISLSFPGKISQCFAKTI